MRPPRPLPEMSTVARSIPCSAAILATTGVITLRPLGFSCFSPFPPGGLALVAALVSGLRAADASGPSGASCVLWDTWGIASSGWPMSANRVPALTVAPSGTNTLSRTPLAGAGISVLTLSVSTSSSGWYSSIASPSAMSHRPTVPSTTLSPSWGMITSVAMSLSC